MRCKQFIVIGGLMLTAQAALANPILDTSKPLICAATQVVNGCGGANRRDTMGGDSIGCASAELDAARHDDRSTQIALQQSRRHCDARTLEGGQVQEHQTAPQEQDQQRGGCDQYASNDSPAHIMLSWIAP